jgi:serine/threonine-protein kinase
MDSNPSHLGRFEILRALGQGGMGQVFLAKDPAIGREVALKTISSDRIAAPMARERFFNEAKAAGALSHPNLITIHEFGEDAGVLYLVMEYLEGEDLSALLRRHALATAQSLDVMAQVCDGLAYAHAKGVLHRDVKPSNVRVVEQSGRLVAKLMDFGVARLPDSQLTGTGDRVGTLSYMAPEYLRGGQPTIQCDLYPVGMMLHEALTGQLPQLGPTLPRGLARPSSKAATEAADGLPARLVPLLHRALAADPADRFPSAEALAAALRSAQKQDSGISGDRIALPPLTAPEPASRLPWIALLGALAAGGIVAWKLAHRPPPPEPVPAATQPEQAAAPQRALPPPPAPASKPEEHLAPTQAPPPAPVDLRAAESEVQQQPQDAWTQAERRLQDHPEDGQAQALRIASLYWMGRYEDMLPAFRSAKSAGFSGDQLGGFPVIHAMLDDQRNNRRIPQELFEQIRPYLPTPRGGQPGEQPPNQQRPPQR